MDTELSAIPVWTHDLYQRPSEDTLLSVTAICALKRSTHLVSIDPVTGDQVWDARVDSPSGWMAADESSMYYLNPHGRLQCFDRENGAVRWERVPGIDRASYGYVVPLAGERLVAGGWRGYTRLECLNSVTSELLWRAPQQRPYAYPIPGPWGIALSCIIHRKQDLTILDPDRGEEVARYPLPDGVRAQDRSSSFTRFRDSLLCTTASGGVFILDPLHDRTWIEMGYHQGGIVTETPTIIEGRLLFQDTYGALCLFDLTQATLVWSVNIVHQNRRDLPAAALGQDRVAIGTSQGRLVIVDRDGTIALATTVARRIGWPLVALSESRLALCSAGAIMALEVRA